MKEMQFSVEIHATKGRVWDTLWQDQTFREWAGLIDPGTYMKGELKEGSEVEFISAAQTPCRYTGRRKTRARKAVDWWCRKLQIN